MAKASAPGAAIIQFLGGIHEIYFPYVLMKPKLILAMIAGGMTGVFLNVLFDVGLRAPAAPGSIFAVYAQTRQRQLPRRHRLGGRLPPPSSFLVGGAPAARPTGPADDGDLAAATAEHGGDEGQEVRSPPRLAGAVGRRHGPIRNIVFACDAGMGSSAMGASVLRKQDPGGRVHADVKVVNKAIANLTDDYDLVVTHQDLTERARQRTPSAIHVSVDNFMGSPRYDEIVELVARGRTAPVAAPVLTVRRCGAERGVRRRRRLLVRESIVLRGRARPGTRRSPRPASCSSRRRCGRAVVRRRDARAGEVGVDPHGQRAGHPARHQRRQGGDHGGRRSRSCATRAASTGTASQASS